MTKDAATAAEALVYREQRRQWQLFAARADAVCDILQPLVEVCAPSAAILAEIGSWFVECGQRIALYLYLVDHRCPARWASWIARKIPVQGLPRFDIED